MVSVECFGVNVPLNTNIYLQEAKGLALALHIKGVQFEEDETDGFGLTRARSRPFSSPARSSADQLTPTTGMVEFRIRAKGFKSAYKIQQGKWLAPILVEEQTSSATASGTAPRSPTDRIQLATCSNKARS